jgi:hypothetical protein
VASQAANAADSARLVAGACQIPRPILSWEIGRLHIEHPRMD